MDDPQLYARTNFMQKRDASMVLEKFLGRMKEVENESILDIGCGPGNITYEVLSPLFPNLKQLVAIDINNDMVNYAAENFKKAELHYVALDITEKEKVEEFSTKWGKFNKIFSFYCLHWISDHMSVLRNVLHLLEEGGQCLLMFVAQCPVFKMYEVMAKDPKWAPYMSDVAAFVPPTQNSPHPAHGFCFLMQEAGLQIKACQILDESYTFNSIEMLQDCMRVVNPFIPRIPEDKVSEYIKHCLLTLSNLRAEEPNANENGHTFSYKLLVALGRKN